MAIYTVSPYVSCANLRDITKYVRPEQTDCVKFHESHCLQCEALKVPTSRRLSCVERRSTQHNNHSSAFSLRFDTQNFGAVSNSAFTHTRDSKLGCQNSDVARVSGMHQVPIL